MGEFSTLSEHRSNNLNSCLQGALPYYQISTTPHMVRNIRQLNKRLSRSLEHVYSVVHERGIPVMQKQKSLVDYHISEEKSKKPNVRRKWYQWLEYAVFGMVIACCLILCLIMLTQILDLKKEMASIALQLTELKNLVQPMQMGKTRTFYN